MMCFFYSDNRMARSWENIFIILKMHYNITTSCSTMKNKQPTLWLPIAEDDKYQCHHGNGEGNKGRHGVGQRPRPGTAHLGWV